MNHLLRKMRKSALLFLFTLLSVGNTAPFLEVWQDDTMILQLDLVNCATWTLRWNHSVTGILVSDYYAYKGEQMTLTDSHTPAFDAGLGHIPGRGRLESDDQHGYWIRDIDEPVSGNAYALRVGSKRVNHRILYQGQTYSLSDLAAGERVILRIQP